MQIQFYPPTDPNHNRAEHKIENKLEAVFFQELMKIIQVESTDNLISGGKGGTPFTSFLNEEYGRILANRMNLKLVDTRSS